MSKDSSVSTNHTFILAELDLMDSRLLPNSNQQRINSYEVAT